MAGNNFILNKIQTVNQNGEYQLNSVTQEVANQANLILQTSNLQLLQPALYIISDQEVLNTENDTRQQGQTNSSFSFFGLPVFDVFTFAKKDYQTNNKEQISVPELSLGLVLLTIGREKNIVITEVQGRDEGIIEYIGAKNYDINIRGIIGTNAQNTYPEKDFAALKRFLDTPESLAVASPVLSRYGISDIVITNYTFGQEEGLRNIQKFEINAISEKPFQLQFTKR